MREFLAIGLAMGWTAPVAAQNGCPVDVPNGAGTVPWPTITSYTVANARAPRDANEAREREAAPHAATVTGGVMDDGLLRFDLVLSEAIRADCRIRLNLIDRALPPAARNDGNSGAVALLTTPALVNSVVSPRNDGSTRISWIVPTRLVTTTRRFDTLGIQLGNNGTTMPFTVTVQPIAPPVVTLTDREIRFGDRSEARIEGPRLFNELPDADRRIEVSLVPAGLGRLDRAQPSGVLFSALDGNFNPPRATATLLPTVIAAAMTGDVVVRFAGHTIRTPLTVLPFRCLPVAEMLPMAGRRIEVEVVNTGSEPCPEFFARLSSSTTPELRVPPLAPGARRVVSLAARRRDLSALQLATAPQPLSSVGKASASVIGSAGDDWTGLFSISAASLNPAGFDVTLTLRTANGQTLQLADRISAAGVAAMRSSTP